MSSELLMAPEDDKGVDEQSMPTVLQMAPEEPIAAAVIHAQLEPEPMPLMQILPADFQLPALTRFCPDPKIKERIDNAVAACKGLVVVGKGPEGLKLADEKLTELKNSITAAVDHFKDPADIAFHLHRHVTSTRGNWVKPAEQLVTSIANDIWRENQRLKDEAEAERRRQQEEANRKAREEAAAEAARLAAAKAPAPVVEKAQERAKTVTAPPVAPVQRYDLPQTNNTVTTVIKAKLASTPDEAEQIQPEITALSKDEQADIQKLLSAIVGGRTDLLSVLSINWGALDKLASAQENTFNVPGFVVFKTGGTRKKPARKAR